MAKVHINCPACKEYGHIDISPDVMKDVTRGLLAVNISSGIICTHSFVAYIDKNMNVRDHFIADFKIELPEISSIEKIKANKVPERDIVDIDLIRLNMPAMQLTYILKSIFLKQKIVLISDQEFLYDHFLNFFKYITQDLFEPDISIINREMYKNEKKKYKDSMVFESYKILNNVKKIINPKKLEIEKKIVNKFISERELGYSYIILKNEIQKAAELSKKIVEFIKDCEAKNENINILKINLQLEEFYSIKINSIYLKFLIEIVSNYYGIGVPSFTDSFFDFL